MSIRLLIADDSADFRDSTSLMVSVAGDIEVVSLAQDGQDAIAQAQQHQPDVAVIDVHMPGLDGLAAIRRLAQVSPTTACLAMSFDGERDVLRQAMTAGARDYLLKPFNSDDIVNAVRRVATRRVPPRRTGGLPPDEHEQAVIERAVGYLRAGRSDMAAAQAYAQLVQLRHLDRRALTRLAEIFLARRDWRTLRLICERLEKRSQSSPLK